MADEVVEESALSRICVPNDDKVEVAFKVGSQLVSNLFSTNLVLLLFSRSLFFFLLRLRLELFLGKVLNKEMKGLLVYLRVLLSSVNDSLMTMFLAFFLRDLLFILYRLLASADSLTESLIFKIAVLLGRILLF